MKKLQSEWHALLIEHRWPTLFESMVRALAPASPQTTPLTMQQARYTKVYEDEMFGFSTPDAAKAEYSRLVQAMTTLIRSITEADLAEQPAPRPAATPELPPPLLHEWHRYTCDRSPQDTSFQKIRQAEDRAQFFYFYGLDRHAHQALVERFAFDLEGLLKSHLNADVGKRCRVARALNLLLLLNGDAEACKTEVLASLFTKFGVDPDSHGPLLQTQLSELWRNSPELRNLGSQDRVCCYMGIPEFDWEREVTPGVVTWFIDEFCGASLPPEAPAFYFFFGVEFEEEDSPVKAEVEAAIRAGGNRVHLLPELGMVSDRDVKRWIRTYQDFMPNREQRDAIYEAATGGAAEIYMEDLIGHLHRIIDQINQPK